MALGTNTAGLVLSANQVTGLLTAQFALPDEYPFEIKVNNSQLSFAAPQLQYKALDYQVTSFLDYDRLGLDKETFPCYGKEISFNLCSNNEFFLAHNVRSDVDKKNVLMVAHSEKFARTRSTAEFYFTQSQASVERVINSGDTDKVMLQWTYNVQKLKTGGEVSDESDWFDFNPEANQVPSPNDPAIDGKITADQILDHLKESNGNAYFDFFDVLISTQSKWLANNVGFLFDRAEASVLASHRTSGVFRDVFTFEFIDPELGTACGDAATVNYPKQNIAYYKLASTHDFMKGWHSSDPNSKGVISHQENNAGNPLLCLTNASETALSMLAYYSEADEVQNYIVNDLPLDGQVCVSKEQYEQYTFLVYDAIFSQYAQAHQLGDDYLAMMQLSDGSFQSFVNKGTFGSKSFIIERTADQFNGNSDIDIKLPIVSSIDPWESDKSFFPRPFEVSATEADGTPLTAFTINVVQQPAHGTLAVEDQTIIYDLLDRDFLGEDSFTFSVTNASGVVSEGSTVELNIVTHLTHNKAYVIN